MIQDRINILRPRCEEVFYTLSSILEKEDAEKLTNSILINILNSELKIHNEFINACNAHIERESKKRPKLTLITAYECGIIDGIILVNQAKLKTHTEAVKRIMQDIEILNFKLI